MIPAQNVPDLTDVAEEVRKKLEIIPVKQISDVLGQALQETGKK